MKKLLILGLLLTSSISSAWISTTPSSKEYSFKYQLKGLKLELKKTGSSYEEAFETAAMQCFKFYKADSKITEDAGLDIIDTCANPRS